MIGLCIGIIASLVFIYPVFQGLILLPLDLLVSNSAPWFLANQILIKNSYMLDSIVQMFPWHHLTFVSLTNGIIPLWNPYQLTGLPFMASMKPMVFYPLNIFFFLGEIRSWNLLLFFQLFLAFYFMYLLMRKFGVSVWGALLSAIAFAFSSLMVGFLQFGSDGHALVWMPFLFYCLYAFEKEQKSRYLVGLSIGLAIGIFAGHLQMTTYQCLFLCLYIAYAWGTKRMALREALFALAAICLGGGIAAIQLMPSIELFSQSFRSLGDMSAQFAGGLIRPHEMLRLFAPDMFGHPMGKDLHVGYIETGAYYGLIPLFFTLFAFRMMRSSHMVRFFGIAFILATVFAMWPFGLLFSFLHIPLITSGSGGRLFSLGLFGGAMLSGYGLDAFVALHDWKKALKWVSIYTVGVLGVLGGAYMVSKTIYYIGATATNLKFPFAILLGFFFLCIAQVYMAKRWRIPVWVFLVCILCASYLDLFRMGYRFLTFSNSKFLYPDIPVIQFVRDHETTVMARSYGLAELEIPTHLGIYSTETYNSLYPVRSARVLRALEGKELSMEPNNVFRFDHGERLKYVFDVLGVSYIVTQHDQNPASTYFRTHDVEKDLTKIYQDEEHDVYENKTVYPRFGLYYQKKDGMDERAILQDIQTKTTDLKTTVLLEEPVFEELRIGTGSVTLQKSTVNSQDFKLTTSTPALFYISDAYFPGWKAFVNGKPSHIYRANYNFRAVLVPEGISDVAFRYEPQSFVVGLYGSSLSLLLLGGLVFIYERNRPSSQDIQTKKRYPKKTKTHTPKK